MCQFDGVHLAPIMKPLQRGFAGGGHFITAFAAARAAESATRLPAGIIDWPHLWLSLLQRVSLPIRCFPEQEVLPVPNSCPDQLKPRRGCCGFHAGQPALRGGSSPLCHTAIQSVADFACCQAGGGHSAPLFGMAARMAT